MDATDRTMQILISTERVADQILQNKQEIISLDKRRQDTREALRELEKHGEPKTWVTVGSLLVEMRRDKAMELMKKDQQHIDQEINKLRSDQKVLVNEHRDLEMTSPIVGYDLVPLSRQEVSAFKDNLPGFAL